MCRPCGTATMPGPASACSGPPSRPGAVFVNQQLFHAGYQGGVPSRRALLQLGGLTWLGLTLPRFLEARAQADTAPARRPRDSAIKSCILIFYYGGPSHLDTWDLKPHAPGEVRGEFRPIATSVPGIRIS